MKPRISHWPQALIALLLASPHAHSRDFGATLTLSSESSDNALKTVENPQDERQDQVQLNLFAKHSGDLVQLDATYVGGYNNFAQGTQVERNTLEGDGKLIFGNVTQPFNLQLSHSRRNLLDTPQSANLLQNTDEREISSVKPIGRLRLSPVDQLLVSAEHSEITYKFASPQDSTRDTGSLAWNHALSKIDALQLLLQQTDIDYQHQANTQYTYRLASLGYSAKLQHLTYSLAAGYNTSESERTGNHNNPSYNLNANYATALGTFGLLATYAITDTSLGDGNASEITAPLASNSLGTGFDQINDQNLQLSWTSHLLCERCTTDLSASLHDKDYFTLPQDTQEQVARATLIYTLSSVASLNFSAQYQKTTFAQTTSLGNFDAQIFRLNYTRQFTQALSGSLYATQEHRSSVQAIQNYDEHRLGLALSYHY